MIVVDASAAVLGLLNDGDARRSLASEAVAVPQIATFQAALQFARSEGIIPAPESAHAIRVVIDEALRGRKQGKRQTILFNLSGHGHFDLGAYEQFLAGKLQDYEYPTAKIEEALRGVPQVKA